MKRFTALWLCLLLALSMTACSGKPPAIQLPERPEPPAEQQPEQTGKREYIPLRDAQHVDPVLFEPDWTVDTTSLSFLQELTSPKYQGRSTGSTGNREAADWIESQYIQWGIQPLPDLEGYRHSYPDQVFEVMPGFAAIVAADGTEQALEMGVDWVFEPSFAEIDMTLPLSADLADCETGKAFLDGDQTEQDYPCKYIQISSGNVTEGRGYDNPKYSASRITVTPEVYQALTAPGTKLHLQLPAAASDGMADNVVGYLPGEDSTHAVLISAHFDGSGQCGKLLPSAYDNGSGTAAMLQTASWLSRAESLPCDVIFAAFNGEENGKDGSRYFSSWIQSQYEQILVVNIDCVGWKGEPTAIYAEDEAIAFANELAGGLEIQYKQEFYSGDQSNFKSKNMAAVTVTQEICIENDAVRAAMHSTNDVTDNLDPAAIDGLAKDICAWVVERGGNTIAGTAYRVIW